MATTALLVLGAAPSAGQAGALPAEKILGKDDAEFARQLSRNGYPDLAEDVRKAMAASGGGAETLEAAMLALEIQQEEAYREPDAATKVQRLEELIEARAAFVASHADKPEAEAVRAGQTDLSRGVGELITQVLADNPEIENAAELRKRGLDILEKAAMALEERLAEPEEEEEAVEPSDGDTGEDEVDLERMVAAYQLARTQYFRSLLYEPGTYERGAIAGKALDVLLDFQLEYSDQLLCFEGFIYEGLCHKARGDLDDAVDSFDAAIDLRTTYEQTPRGVYKMAPEAADIVSSAVLQKMLLLGERGDHAGAVEVAKDFMATTEDGWKALKGLAVLAQLADAYKALGDREGLTQTAKMLVDLDPTGPGGARGREILGTGGSSGGLATTQLLKLAESKAQSDPEHAIQLCLQIVSQTRGTPEQSDLGARTGLLLGALYAQRGLLHESVVAWDTAADRYAQGKDAPECMWRAINGYLTLQGQEKRPVYKTLAQERVNELLKRYPQHSYASMAGLIEGQQAEAEGDFARAAELYERIAPGAAGYEEALYRGGNAWSRQARKLFEEKKPADAKQAVQRAEGLLAKARTAAAEGASKTLEISLQDRLRAVVFNSRIALANLYLMDDVKRAGEVAALFEGIDAELAQDATRTSMVWDLRFRALAAQGKRDEAIALIDAQILRDTNASWVEVGARSLAPVLDARAMELMAADPRSTEAETLMRKAAAYYQLAIRGQLQGRDAVNLKALEPVADRLYILGLHFAGVPMTVDSFVDYEGPQVRSDLLEQAARAYEIVIPLKPTDHLTPIKLARTLAFLGRWETAAARYAELFGRESFANPVTKTIDQNVVRAKPELLFAYLEWGECERAMGDEHSDSSRLTRALDIFQALVLGTTQGGKLWWAAKYFQLRALTDRGDYETAHIALGSLQNTYPRYDEGEFGLEKRFVDLSNEVKEKVPQ